MNIVILFECSGAVRRAFVQRGHVVVSVDLKKSEDETGNFDPDTLTRSGFYGNGYHYRGDALDFMLRTNRAGMQWDMLIAHPDCTYLTVAANGAFKGPNAYTKTGTRRGPWRKERVENALEVFEVLLQMPVPKIAVENPIGIASTRIRKPDQIIQPFEFGHSASKATCLWLKNLPPLVKKPQLRAKGRLVEWPPGSGKITERFSNQTDSGQNKLPPGKNRATDRARTYAGIAFAMAELWG